MGTVSRGTQGGFTSIDLGLRHQIVPEVAKTFFDWVETSPEDRAKYQMLEKIAKAKAAGFNDLSTAPKEIQDWIGGKPTPSNWDKVLQFLGKKMPEVYTKDAIPEKTRETVNQPSTPPPGMFKAGMQAPKQVESYRFEPEAIYPTPEQYKKRVKDEEQFGYSKEEAPTIARKELKLPSRPKDVAKESFDANRALVDLYYPNVSDEEKTTLTQYLAGFLGKELPDVQRANSAAVKQFIALRAKNPKASFAQLLTQMPEDMQTAVYALIDKMEAIFGKEQNQGETREERAAKFEEDKRHHRALEGAAFERIRNAKTKEKKDQFIKDTTKKVNNLFDRFDKDYERVVTLYTRPTKEHPAPKGEIPTRDEFWSSKAGSTYRREWYDVMGSKPTQSGLMEIPTRQQTVDALEELHNEGVEIKAVKPPPSTSKLPAIPAKVGGKSDPLRERAIAELNNGGHPITEANIKYVMEQLGKQ